MPPSPSPRPHGTEPPVRDRGDACPGALRLHSAADGRLARVRLPAGYLTAHQAMALADAAERLGDGHLSLTSRGNAELRGLPDGCGQELADLLRDAGLLPSARHERIRNILASPLAGLDHRTPSDVQLWARQLDALLCASASATALSGRFLFVLDDGRGDVAALGGDVTLVADGAGAGAPGAASRSGALLRIGDDPAAVRIAGPDVPRAALTAAEIFLTAAEASGTGAWRVRELPAGYALNARDVADRLRGAGVRAEYVGTEGVGMEGVGSEGVGSERVGSERVGSERVGSERVGSEGVGRTSVVPSGRVPVPAPVPGVVEGPDGRRALSVLAPLGRVTVAQWRLLAAAADEDGCGELRVTPWRGVVVPGLPAATAEPRLRELAAAGLITDPASPWHRIGACTGRPGCAKSRSDVRADAAAAITRGQLPVHGQLPIYWSGCERRCGHPHGTWVDVLATGDGYQVSVVRPEPPPHPAAAATTTTATATAITTTP